MTLLEDYNLDTFKPPLGHYFLTNKKTGDCLHNIHSPFLPFKRNLILFSWPSHTTWLRGSTPNSQLPNRSGSLYSNRGNSMPLACGATKKWECLLGKASFLWKKKQKKEMASRLPLNTGGLGQCSQLAANLSTKSTLCGDKSTSENFGDTVTPHPGCRLSQDSLCEIINALI